MNVRLKLVAALAAFLGLASQANAAPVAVDLTALRAIQTYNLVARADDQAFLYVSGIAKGAEIEPAKLPKEAWTIGPRTPPVTAKKPLALWSGDLAEGEFAMLTVTLFQGKGDDAALKAFAEKRAEGEKKVALRAAAKLASPAELKKLATETLKAHRETIKKIKEIFPDKKTDHYGGQFTLVIWNNAGKLTKRLDPVGLTFGEDDGTGVKTYTKIKRTRQNVLVQDEDNGAWSEEQILPLNDEDNAIRVKMFDAAMAENEGKKFKNDTDYLAELKIKFSGKVVKWRLGNEVLGKSDIHTYWEWAE